MLLELISEIPQHLFYFSTSTLLRNPLNRHSLGSFNFFLSECSLWEIIKQKEKTVVLPIIFFIVARQVTCYLSLLSIKYLLIIMCRKDMFQAQRVNHKIMIWWGDAEEFFLKWLGNQVLLLSCCDSIDHATDFVEHDSNICWCLDFSASVMTDKHKLLVLLYSTWK